MPIEPDMLKMPGYPAGSQEQLFAGHVAVIRFVDGEREGFDKDRNMPAELVLPPQLFSCAFMLLATSCHPAR